MMQNLFFPLTCLYCLFVSGRSLLRGALKPCLSEAQTRCRLAASSTAGAEGSGDANETFTKLNVKKIISLNMNKVMSYQHYKDQVSPAGPALTISEELQLLR